jgi:hypothetical protein
MLDNPGNEYSIGVFNDSVSEIYGQMLYIVVRGFHRLRNVNIVGLFTVYLITKCFGNTTIFMQTYIC